MNKQNMKQEKAKTEKQNEKQNQTKTGCKDCK